MSLLDRKLSQSETRAKEQLISDFNVSRETCEALGRYQTLLDKWAGQINLVGASTLSHFWERHVLDCAQILLVANNETATLADFGSGAGLPGLILACILRDRTASAHATLIEVSGKRCGFLREAARALEVSVSIRQEKIEVCTPLGVDLVTARAFAPLRKLLGYAYPWAEKGAHLIFLKGEDVQRELEEASTNWSFQSRVTQSLTDSRGCLLEIVDLQPI